MQLVTMNQDHVRLEFVVYIPNKKLYWNLFSSLVNEIYNKQVDILLEQFSSVHTILSCSIWFYTNSLRIHAALKAYAQKTTANA
jgi:hypothetical protein